MPPTPTTPQPPILRLLGGALIEADGVPLGGPGAHRHRIALLALLAVSKRPVSRDKLMGYLWPERDTDSARALLRTALYELRKLLGEDAIRRTGDALSIEPTLLRCDVLEFEIAVAANDFDRAAALYAGAFLDGFFLKEASEFERWVDEERARLERLHARVRANVRDEPLLPRIERVAEPKATASSPSPAPSVSAQAQSDDATPFDDRTRKSKLRSRSIAVVLSISVVLALVAASILFRHPIAIVSPPPRAVVLSDTAPGSALEFDGLRANASTELGHVITHQTDDIAIEMMVKYDGARSDSNQALFYNGQSAFSGWGILVLSGAEKEPDGTIAVLAGGVRLVATPFVLKRGVWQHVRAERRHGSVTVALDDSAFDLGPLRVNPLGEEHQAIEHTVVGGAETYDSPHESFHGVIDRVQVRDLSNTFFIERWFFDEGSGPITVGRRDEVLHIGSATWVRGAPVTAREVLWARLDDHCGQSFGGTVNDSTAVLHIFECTASEIGLAIHVGTDRSRTMFLSRHGDDLSLRAARHRSDGGEDAAGRFAGTLSPNGGFAKQEFDGSGAGDVARIAVKPDTLLTYDVRQRGADRDRMTFNLTKQVATPASPWGIVPNRQ